MRVVDVWDLKDGDTAWCRHCNRRIVFIKTPIDDIWSHPKTGAGFCDPKANWLTAETWAEPRPQAKDLSVEAFLAGMRQAFRVNKYGDWASPQELSEILNMPFKVILAKAWKLIDWGIIDGCACGCSGQFQILKEATDGG